MRLSTFTLGTALALLAATPCALAQTGYTTPEGNDAQYQPGGNDMDMHAPYAPAPAYVASPAPVAVAPVYMAPAPAYVPVTPMTNGDRVTVYGQPHMLNEGMSTMPTMAPAPIEDAPVTHSGREQAASDQNWSMPEVQTGADGSSFISGGVTGDERTTFAAMAKDYSLKIATSNTSGELVSDVDIKVMNGKGQSVFETKTDGPILLAKLAPGRYRIEANKGGVNKTQTVEIGKGLKSINIIWPTV